MAVLLTCGAMAVLLGGLLGPVLAWVALQRANEARERAASLERELAHARGELAEGPPAHPVPAHLGRREAEEEFSPDHPTPSAPPRVPLGRVGARDGLRASEERAVQGPASHEAAALHAAQAPDPGESAPAERPASDEAPAPPEPVAPLFDEGPPEHTFSAEGSTPRGAPDVPSRWAGAGDGSTGSNVPTAPEPGGRRVDWERWIGVRGAAVAGGIFAALAGLFLFQYAVQQGLVDERVRLAGGTLAGIAAIVAGQWLRPRGYRYAPEALCGAGVAILYAASWAAHKRYELVPFGVSFAAMVVVTVVACALAVRHGSKIVATLGLLGGFATPFVLSSGADRPFGLFGYILLLDLGLLFVGRRRRWSVFGLAALLGTFVVQSVWIFTRLDPGELAFGLVMLGVFALLFAFAGTGLGRDEEGSAAGWVWSRSGAVLLPLCFAIYFPLRVDLGPHFYPIGLLLLLLASAACWLARREPAPWMPLGAAVGAVASLAVWAGSRREGAFGWEGALAAIAIAAVIHVFTELRKRDDGSEAASAVAPLGFACALFVGALVARDTLTPWLVGIAAMAALLLRRAALRDAALQLAAAPLVPVAVVVYSWSAGTQRTLGTVALQVCLLGAVLAFLLQPLLRRDATARTWGWHAAAIAALFAPPFLLHGAPFQEQASLWMLFLALAHFAATSIAGACARTAVWHAIAVLYGWVALAGWVGASWRAGSDPLREPVLALGALAALASAVPFAARLRFDGHRAAVLVWLTAAAAPMLAFVTLFGAVDDALGDRWTCAVALGLGALVAAFAYAAARAPWEVEGSTPDARRVALAALVTCAAGLLAAVVPLRVHTDWLTVTLALWGLALARWWRPLASRAVRAVGALLLVGALVTMFLKLGVHAHYAKQGWPVLNALLWSNAVPAICMLLGAGFLRESDESGHGSRELRVAVALSGIAGLFVWLNLAIVDVFCDGEFLVLTTARHAARDLTMSVAWTAYALLLLGVGMARRISGLRWVSLVFLVGTIGKVFLYDLGELEGLYRVASFAGLGMSLIFVSLLYQRFVFGRGGEEPEAVAPPPPAGLDP